jgi:hypothetical protein
MQLSYMMADLTWLAGPEDKDRRSSAHRAMRHTTSLARSALKEIYKILF